MPATLATKKMVLKKINVLSLAKFFTLFYLIIGLVIAVAAFFGSVLSYFLFNPVFYSIPFLDHMLIISGPSILFIYPLLSAIMGFIVGAVIGLIYNLVASWIGGIELEFES